ncbi:MAG: nitroreductase family protein [Thermodesulfobacteriota bacterium]
MTVIEAIQARKSCRTYSGTAVEPGKLSELRQFLSVNTRTPFGGRVRFELADLNDTEAGEVKGLTTYGVIRGARQFIAGCVERGPRAMEDYGYSMERNILQATSMGLGTCWLGGTFKRSGFADRIRIGEDEVLPAVTPVGYPGDKRSVVDRLFRYTAASDKRKHWNELFYLVDTGHALEERQSGEYKIPLECVRLAPSASNKQPWRIILAGDRHALHFYLKRTPGYGHMGKDIELQNVDMGIAMCHFELSAKELGLKGGWSAEDPCITPAGLEYVASWT